jgi:hypothetical protein
MSYGLFAAGRKTVLVFDMGGGTTDASVICIDEGEYKVAAVNGHSACGGQDFDDVLFVRNPRVLVAPRRHLPVPRVCVVSPKERDPSFTAPPTQTCLEI